MFLSPEVLNEAPLILPRHSTFRPHLGGCPFLSPICTEPPVKMQVAVPASSGHLRDQAGRPPKRGASIPVNLAGGKLHRASHLPGCSGPVEGSCSGGGLTLTATFRVGACKTRGLWLVGCAWDERVFGSCRIGEVHCIFRCVSPSLAALWWVGTQYSGFRVPPSTDAFWGSCSVHPFISSRGAGAVSFAFPVLVVARVLNIWVFCLPLPLSLLN
jgi:hypothetical protein